MELAESDLARVTAYRLAEGLIVALQRLPQAQQAQFLLWLGASGPLAQAWHTGLLRLTGAPTKANRSRSFTSFRSA